MIIGSSYGHHTSQHQFEPGNAGVAFFIAGISLSYRFNDTPLFFVRSEAFLCIPAVCPGPQLPLDHNGAVSILPRREPDGRLGRPAREQSETEKQGSPNRRE
jgi:hypothetical protein